MTLTQVEAAVEVEIIFEALQIKSEINIWFPFQLNHWKSKVLPAIRRGVFPPLEKHQKNVTKKGNE